MKKATKLAKENTAQRLDNNGAAYLHEYVDLYCVNANNIDELPVPVSFTQTRNKPFLYKPDDYYLSVVRFQIDTNSLPVFAPFIQFNQNNRDLTIYSVTLSWTNPIAPFQTFNQRNYIIWSPQDLASPIPQPPSITQNKFQDDSGGYYYAYNYSYFLQLINDTFVACYNQLNIQVILAGLTLPTIYSPVMTWNTDKGIAVINADVLGYDNTALNYISIYFNLPMYNLFSSMPAYLESGTSALGKNYRIDTSSFGNSTVIGFPFYAPTYNALQVFQETPVLSLWSPVNGIVITSNTLPINSTNIANPCVFLNGIPTNNNGNNSNVSPVITDFQAPDGQYKNSITYIPSAQYRYIDLTGNGPLYTIDINIYWRNKAGQYIPFRLSSGCTAFIKILFQKKDQSIQGSTAQEFNKMV